MASGHSDVNSSSSAEDEPRLAPHQPPDQREIDSRSVYVGNVDFRASDSDVRRFLATCGVINRITILNDRHTGKRLGYAYVEFEHRASVKVALELHGAKLKGRTVSVVRKRTNYPGMSVRRGPRSGYSRHHHHHHHFHNRSSHASSLNASISSRVSSRAMTPELSSVSIELTGVSDSSASEPSSEDEDLSQSARSSRRRGRGRPRRFRSRVNSESSEDSSASSSPNPSSEEEEEDSESSEDSLPSSSSSD